MGPSEFQRRQSEVLKQDDLKDTLCYVGEVVEFTMASWPEGQGGLHAWHLLTCEVHHASAYPKGSEERCSFCGSHPLAGSQDAVFQLLSTARIKAGLPSLLHPPLQRLYAGHLANASKDGSVEDLPCKSSFRKSSCGRSGLMFPYMFPDMNATAIKSLDAIVASD